MKSLEQWICDRCGQVIEEPNQGSVEWIDDSKTHKASGFKIVHQSFYSPRDNGECYHYSNHPRQIGRSIGRIHWSKRGGNAPKFP